MDSSDGNYVISSLEKNRRVLIKYIPKILIHQKVQDVHKIRVAVKKINSTYGLIEFIFPGTFNRKEHYGKIKDIFQRLGKLREIQLHDGYIKKRSLPASCLKPYKKFHLTEKERIKRKLKLALKTFDESSIGKSIRLTERLCLSLNNKEFLRATKRFIKKEVREINTLLVEHDSPGKIHTIRKLLKSLTYKVTFLNAIKPGVTKDALISLLKETETLIGAWHDKVRLIQYINKFKERNLNAKPDTIKPFNALIGKLSIENAIILSRLKPKLKDIMLTLKSI